MTLRVDNKAIRKYMKYNLVENAADSLYHAVEHITNIDGVTSYDYKRAILDIYHSIELLLKERVKRIDEKYVWRNGKTNGRSSIGALEAIEFLGRHAGINVGDKHKNTIRSCKRIRDNIQHYEYEMEDKEVRGLIGRMVSLIIDFSKEHLNIDFEKQLRNDEKWESLIEIYEFWNEHKNVVEKELLVAEMPVLECPNCGAITFVIESNRCRMCNHYEETVECDLCNQEVVKSDIQVISMDDYSNKQNACHYCIEKMMKQIDVI